MSKQFHEINWDKVLYKRAMKDYKKLAALYADVLLSRETWEDESDMWMNKYYKLLKKNKSLKKDNKEFRGLIEDWALVESDEPTRRAMLEAIGSEVKE